MTSSQFDRRAFLAGTAALAGATLLPGGARASGSMTAAIYPGTWDDTYRRIVAPALKKAHGIDVSFEPLFAVDQLAKVAASRGLAPFDAMVLDPGPRAAAIERGLFEPFDPSKLSNASKLPDGYADQYGAAVNAQIVGIAYNPKKLPKPTKWTDLFEEPFVSRLGLTGFQTTFGTVSLIEMAKQFGGSATNVEPIFDQIRKILPKVAAVTAPAALPGLFQQGQIDVTYTNTQNVATLASRGVDIDIAFPETGAITFITSLHIAKGAENVEAAYKYIDTALDAAVQAEMMKPPATLIPVNKDVPLEGVKISSLDELKAFVTHDWSVINPQRAAWIERFNKEVTK
jgi:putative spermidine/putrescine transport system substrate-binding protein